MRHTTRAARKAFEACRRKWEECRITSDSAVSQVTVESPTLCSRKTEEYLVDFEHACERVIKDKKLVGRLVRGAEGAATDAQKIEIGQAILKMPRSYSLIPKLYFNMPIKDSLTVDDYGRPRR